LPFRRTKGFRDFLFVRAEVDGRMQDLARAWDGSQQADLLTPPRKPSAIWRARLLHSASIYHRSGVIERGASGCQGRLACRQKRDHLAWARHGCFAARSHGALSGAEIDKHVIRQQSPQEALRRRPLSKFTGNELHNPFLPIFCLSKSVSACSNTRRQCGPAAADDAMLSCRMDRFVSVSPRG
jgi:hypothetical protein